MTRQQQAIKLINQLDERNLEQVIEIMTDLLKGIQPHIEQEPDSTMSPEELRRRFDELREKLSKYPVEDIDTARAAVLSTKYPLSL